MFYPFARRPGTTGSFFSGEHKSMLQTSSRMGWKYRLRPNNARPSFVSTTVVLVTGCTGVFDRSANKEQKSEIRFFIASLYTLPSTIRFTQRVDRVSIGLFYNALWRIVCSKTIIEQIAFVTSVVSFWQRWRAWRWIDCHVRHCPKLIVGERFYFASSPRRWNKKVELSGEYEQSDMFCATCGTMVLCYTRWWAMHFMHSVFLWKEYLFLLVKISSLIAIQVYGLKN